MTNHFDYRDKFYAARNDLASESGSLRKRIGDVFQSHIQAVIGRNLPPDMKSDYDRLMVLLTQEEPARWDTGFEASLAKMHWKQLKECAELIVRLATKADERAFKMGRKQ